MLRGVTCWCSWRKAQLPTTTFWVDHSRFRSRAENPPRTLNSPNQFRERQSSHFEISQELSRWPAIESRMGDGDVEMRGNDRATSRANLALSLGAAAG